MKVMRKGAVVAALVGGFALSGGGVAAADSGALGGAVGSPGVLSGNVVQIPIHIPVNVCGNSLNLIGLLNPAAGNVCANVSGHHVHGKAGADKSAGAGRSGNGSRTGVASVHHTTGATAGGRMTGGTKAGAAHRTAGRMTGRMTGGTTDHTGRTADHRTIFAS